MLGVPEFFAVDTLIPDQLLLDTMQAVGRQLGQVMARQRAAGNGS